MKPPTRFAAPRSSAADCWASTTEGIAPGKLADLIAVPGIRSRM